MALHPFDQAILKLICDYGIITSLALERAILAAKPPVVSGYNADALFDALTRLSNQEFIGFEQLPGDLPAFSIAPAGAQQLGRPMRQLSQRPEDRWVKTMEADLRVAATVEGAHLTLNLAPDRAKLCAWYQNQYFSGDRDKYIDPPEPARPPGLHDKVWSLKVFEHKRNCVIRQIYREQICNSVISWFDSMLSEVTSSVEAPRYFVISPSGRPTAVLFRLRTTLPKTWNRQMKALALMDKILVLPEADLVEQYDEQTENELEAPSFGGGLRTVSRRIDIIPPARFHGVAGRFAN